MPNMKRVNQILESDSYQTYLQKNEAAEKDRKFCHHDMVHFLDVARIASLLNQEENFGIEKDLIYAAALLHDIGRWQQYEDGTPHEIASEKLATEILIKTGFNKIESGVVLEAIRQHRNKESMERRDLSGLLYRADKLSRACFAFKAEKECNWKGDKKNMRILI